MSIGIKVTLEGLERAQSVLDRLNSFEEEQLLDEIGGLGERQTRRRIESEKTPPDGAPWAPNRDRTSLLIRSGNLRDSIAFEVGASSVRWGSSWEFAHIHQNGATIVPKSARALVFMSGGAQRFAKKVTIPARPFVGVSAANMAEIDHLVTDFLGHLVR